MNALKIDDSILQYKQVFFLIQKRGARLRFLLSLLSFFLNKREEKQKEKCIVNKYFGEREFSFHINFYNNWNEFYDDDFIIQIIKHALDLEVNSP